MYAVIGMLLFHLSSDATSRSIAENVLTAYNANRIGLAKHGSIRYRFSSATIPAIDIEDLKRIDSIAQGGWKPEYSIEGTFEFNGRNLFSVRLYPLELMLKRRVKISATSFALDTISFKDLSDGDSTLSLHITPDPTGDGSIDTPYLTPGMRVFYEDLREFPLELGDTDPKDYDLSVCLAKALENKKNFSLILAKESDVDPGIVEIEVDETPDIYTKYSYHFLIDIKRGATPLKSWMDFSIDRTERKSSFRSLWLLSDIRPVEGSLWFPFRKTGFVQDTIPASTRTCSELRYDILMADFSNPPDESAFKIELEEPHAIIDSFRGLRHPARKVWDLASISSKKFGSLKKVEVSSPQGPPPQMPGTWKAGPSWLSLVYYAAGFLLIAFGAYRVYKRRVG